MLVGELRGNAETGHIELEDNTGHLLVAPCHTLLTHHTPHTHHAHTTCVLSGLRANVLISNFDIIAEKTERVQKDVPNETRFFIVAKKIFLTKNTLTKENIKLPSKLTICIYNKNAVHEDPSLCFVALARVTKSKPPKLHVALNFSKDVFNLYSFINNGCVYELTSRDPLPSINHLVDSPAIDITKSMELQFVGYSDKESAATCVDLAEVISQCPLPSLPIITSRAAKQSAR